VVSRAGAAWRPVVRCAPRGGQRGTLVRCPPARPAGRGARGNLARPRSALAVCMCASRTKRGRAWGVRGAWGRRGRTAACAPASIEIDLTDSHECCPNVPRRPSSRAPLCRRPVPTGPEQEQARRSAVAHAVRLQVLLLFGSAEHSRVPRLRHLSRRRARREFRTMYTSTLTSWLIKPP